jgi:hypothetical protein
VASSREYLIAETIYDKFNGSAELGVSCPDGLKFVITKQPADTSALTEPYCNFTIDISNVRNQAGTAVQPITAIVRFEVYGAVASQVSAALGDLQNTFCWGQTLADPTGGTFLSMTADAGSRINQEMWARGGRINWQGLHIAKVMVSL